MPRISPSRVAKRVVLAEDAGDTEVGDLQHAVRPEEDVLRLHVAVQDPVAVGAAQARTRHHRDGTGRPLVESPVDEPAPDGAPGEAFHDQDAGVVVLDVVVDRDDVGVVDGRQDLCLGQEP